MCQSSPTRLEKDLTSPLTPIGTWNTIPMHSHDSFLLPQTIKIFTFTWGAHLMTLHLWGFFKSELRPAEIWDVSFTQVFSQYPGLLQIHPLCSPETAVAVLPLSWSGILSPEAEAIHYICVQLASRSCCPNLCSMQNNLGYCNTHITCAHGKVDL